MFRDQEPITILAYTHLFDSEPKHTLNRSPHYPTYAAARQFVKTTPIVQVDM